jgi:6-phospho-beta-glucosidase
MATQKLVFLGGGSPFTPSIFQALLENKEALSGSEICLMDLSEARLPRLVDLGRAMAQRADVDLTFTSTTDARRALDGATFVFPGYRVGGIEAMRQDFIIPTRHGICGDETAGPGGTFMAQCTIPATLSYCRMMEELCPDAWAISYVNPTNFVADAVRRETRTKFIAVCDCFPGFVEGLAGWLGVPPDDLRARAIGVNHMTWVTSLNVRGEDGYPLLASKMGELLEALEDDREEWTFAQRIYEAYGYVMVCPGHPRMMWEHDATMESRRERWEDPTIGGRDQRMRELWDYVEQMIQGAPYDDTRSHMSMHHPRHALGIAVSIITNDGREWGGMNFPNTGAISNLPLGAIVEGHCIVDGRGPTPVAVGELPKAVLGMTQHIINWQELTVDAALTGDKRLLYQALLASPYVHDMGAARAIMDELLVAHADYMPQFKS